MRKVRKGLLAVGLIFFFVGLSMGEGERRVLLKITFEEGLKPEKGGYFKKLTYGSSKNIEFVEGKEGKAIRVGVKGDDIYQVVYFFKDSGLSAHNGSLEFWFRPLDWEVTEDNNHALVNFMGGSSYMAIDKIGVRGGSTKLRFIYGIQNKGYNNLQMDIKKKEKGHWYHVLVGWSEEKIVMQLDGEEKELEVDPRIVPVENFKNMRLGFTKGCPIAEGLTDIDTLIIYDRSPEELSRTEHLPYVVVGRRKGEIHIDGSLKEKGWGNSVLLTGFVDIRRGLYSLFQPSVYLLYDEKFLYIGVESPLEEGKELVSNAETRDSPVWRDDCVEIYLDPTPQTIDAYQIVINSKGTIFDEILNRNNEKGNDDVTWNIEGMEVGNRVEENRWTLEVKIPFSSLGVKSPEEGREWLFNVCRTIPGWGYFSLCNVRGAYYQREHLGTLLFSSNLPQVRISSWGELYNQKADLLFGYRGGEDRKVEAIVEVKKWDHMSGRFVVIRSSKVNLTEKVKAIFKGGKEAIPTTGRIEVTVRSDGEKIYQQWLPYEKIASLEITRLMITGRRREKLNIFFQQNIKPFKNRITIMDKEGTTVISSEVKIPRNPLLLDISELTPGEYKVRLEAIDGEGKILQSDQKEFTVFSFPPPWEGNRIGISERVPFPWTPVKIKKEGGRIRVSCWGREYVFPSTSLLPQRILSQSKDYVRDSRLILYVDGEEIALKDVKHRVIQKNDLYCLMEGEAHSEKCEVRMKVKVEFDGFAQFEISLSPVGKIRLDGLRLEWRMPSEYTRLLNSGYRSLKDTGYLPSRWKRHLTLDFPYFWVGDEDGGVIFFAIPRDGWRNKDPLRQVEIKHGEMETVVRINMVDKPFEMTEEIARRINYKFGLMATPVRPLVEGYRHWRISSSLEREGTNFNIWCITNKWDCYPEWEITPSLRSMRRKGIRSTWYLSYALASPNSPEFIYMGDQWEKNPPCAPYGKQSWKLMKIGYCPVKGYRDFFLWRLAQSMKDPALDGLYFDNTFLTACRREDHGHGYIGIDGKRKPDYPIEDFRAWLLRIYNFVKERDRSSPIVMHISGKTAYLPSYSFFDAIVDGELGFEEIKKAGGSYYWLSLDKFRAEFMGRVWGYPVIFLPEFPISQKPKFWSSDKCTPIVRHLIGLCLVHDTLFWACRAPHKVYLGVWKALNRFGLDDGDEFIPYWERDTGIKLTPKDDNLVVSAYVKRKEHKALLVIFNNTDKERTVKVKLSPHKFFGEGVEIRDMEEDRRLGEGCEFDLLIKKRDFRLVMVEKK